MKTDRVVAIARRELAAIRRARAVYLPMIILPALIFVLIPAFIAILPQVIADSAME